MRVITETGAQDVISLSPENKQALEVLEVGQRGKEKVLRHVGAVGGKRKKKRKQKKTKKKRNAMALKRLVIPNNSSLHTINCIHQNH